MGRSGEGLALILSLNTMDLVPGMWPSHEGLLPFRLLCSAPGVEGIFNYYDLNFLFCSPAVVVSISTSGQSRGSFPWRLGCGC